MTNGHHPIQVKARWMREVGQRFRQVRKMLGYSQHELSHLLDASPSMMSLIENGKMRGEATLKEHIRAACVRLALDKDWLLHGKGKPPEGLVVPAPPPAVRVKPALGQAHVLNMSTLQRAGRKIRAGRNAMGITQAKFALLVKTESGTLSAIERGFSKKHFELHALKCCEVLGVSYDWLFESEDGVPHDTPEESLSDQLRRLEHKVDKIMAALHLK